MSNAITKIFEQIDRSRDGIIKLQAGLTSKVAFGPENGGTGEHDKVTYAENILKELQPDLIEKFKAPDKRARDGFRPNLITKWNGVDTTSTVWILCHSDIVPPGDPELWKSDPYQIKVEGDRIIGRGVEDNQHGFVSFYLSMKHLLESGIKPERSVGLAFVADEETGSEYGLNFLLNHHGELFGKDDLIIVPDGGNDDGTMIEVAEKSMLWVRFTVTGEQCHASAPHKGKNSLLTTAELILALQALKSKFYMSDDLFSPPVSTFEPTKIEANVQNVNTLPGRDVCYIDCRILPSYKVDNILSEIAEITHAVSQKKGLKIEFDPVYRLDASGATPVDAPVVKSLAAAIKRVTGRDANPMGIGGGTVAAFFRRAGLPAAVWSTVSDTAHQPNEFCLISNIMIDAKVLSCVFTSSS
jgi:succinyl-diaminopimelate desuccinylase